MTAQTLEIPLDVMTGETSGSPTVPSSSQESTTSQCSSSGTLPDPKQLLDDIRRSYSEQQKAEAWAKTAGVVKTYSDELVKRWNTEIDTLLVYGGLFSAILTAFNVQSYQLLQLNSQDLTLAALQQISAQLGSLSVNAPFVNSSQPVFSQSDVSASTVPAWAIWLNTLWFAGLICSLAAASVGIMVKQWLHEFLSGLSGTSREIARRRQFRLNNLSKWQVATIVGCLPMLLQLSLVLFLSGLLVLLWQLDPIVAGVSTALISVLLFFMIGATVLSALIIDCCYISPITFLIYPITERILYIFRAILLYTAKFVDFLASKSRHLSRFPTSIPQSWRDRRPTRTRRGRGLAGIEGRREMLDSDQIRTAYELTMDLKYLAVSGTACLADLDYDAAVSTIQHVAAIDHRHRLSELVDILDPPMDFWAYALLRLAISKGEQPVFNPKVWECRGYHTDAWVLWRSTRAEDADRVTRILVSLSQALSPADAPSSKFASRILASTAILNAHRLRQHVLPGWKDVQDAFAMVISLPCPRGRWDMSDSVDMTDDIYQHSADFLIACARLGDAPSAKLEADVRSWVGRHHAALVRVWKRVYLDDRAKACVLRALYRLSLCDRDLVPPDVLAALKVFSQMSHPDSALVERSPYRRAFDAASSLLDSL
ncbi:hypothetical protein C8Q80DRAFT_520128 [Daedaleopsis nitida]|nr:hypothetical protein C8Q80DRAFT_520128 [Daedaleopsis nitida]